MKNFTNCKWSSEGEERRKMNPDGKEGIGRNIWKSYIGRLGCNVRLIWKTSKTHAFFLQQK